MATAFSRQLRLMTLFSLALFLFHRQPCQSFSPHLKKFYEHVSDRIEIVYISSDNSVPEFEGYFAKMPWKSLPADGTASIKNRLAQACHITGIPALIVLDRKTGDFITDAGRDDVGGWKEQGARDAAVQVVEKWKSAESVPLSEAKFSGGASGGLMGMVMTILKNPAFIFGMIYIFKVRNMYARLIVIRMSSFFVYLLTLCHGQYAWRHLKKYLPEADAPMVEEQAPPPASDSEF